jgi:hypothetical protein
MAKAAFVALRAFPWSSGQVSFAPGGGLDRGAGFDVCDLYFAK